MSLPHARRSDRFIYLALKRAHHMVPWLRRFVPHSLGGYLVDRGIPGHDSRRYLEEVVLAGLARGRFQRVLFVGCRRYTSHYGRWFHDSDTELWTLDIDPGAARWGEPGRHLLADVQRLDEACGAGELDAVLLNGVFGFGVDDSPSMERTVEAAWRGLRLGGLLMIGWDRPRVPDPSGLDAMRHFTRSTEAPFQHIDWPGEEIVFDFFIAEPVDVSVAGAGATEAIQR